MEEWGSDEEENEGENPEVVDERHVDGSRVVLEMEMEVEKECSRNEKNRERRWNV